VAAAAARQAGLDEQLLLASERGEREEVKRLLRAGARLEARTDY